MVLDDWIDDLAVAEAYEREGGEVFAPAEWNDLKELAPLFDRLEQLIYAPGPPDDHESETSWDQLQIAAAAVLRRHNWEGSVDRKWYR
jgi:hypothetical protein